MKKSRKITKILYIIAPFLVAIAIAITGYFSVAKKSYTFDEHRHLVRGIMLLETGDYRLNKHHPILANVLNAIPQLFNPNYKSPGTNNDYWDDANKDAYARLLAEVNGSRKRFSLEVINPSRYVTIGLFAASVVLFYFLIKKEFGIVPASGFTLLYAFSPNIFAHARLVTTDAMAVITIFLATWYLYKYLKYKTKGMLIAFIITSFLALLTKYGAVPIAFVWVALIYYFEVFIIQKKKNKKKKLIKKLLSGIPKVALIVVCWVVLLTAAYGFRFTTLAATNHDSKARTESHLHNFKKMFEPVPFLIGPVQHFYMYVPVPFPEYIQGFIENVVFHNSYGHGSFLYGDYRSDGWWYYFPLTMLAKMPVTGLIGTLAVVGWGIWLIIKRYKSAKGFKKFIKNMSKLGPSSALIIVPAFYYMLSMSSSINLGIRHILIVFPFIYVGAGILVEKILKKNLKYLFIIIPLGLWYVYSFVSIYPHYISYFNEIVGGPKNGYKYLLDSNLSWGQDELMVEEYKESLPDSVKVYDNSEDPVEDGIAIIDANFLMSVYSDKRERASWIRDPVLAGEIKPIKWIGYSHMVFEFDSEDED